MSIFFFAVIFLGEVTAMGRRIRHDSGFAFGQFRAQLILLVSFLGGGLIGTLFPWVMSWESKLFLRDYLVDYLGLFREEILRGSFPALLWDALSFYFLLLLLGFVFLGVLGIPLLCFVQGFFLAFGCACFWHVFGSSGLLPAFALFGLPSLFWAPVLFLVGAGGFVNALPQSGSRFDLFSLRRAVVCFGALLSCVLFEYWVVPILLCTSAKIVFGTR